MEDKNTVIDAKIGNLNELTKVLSVKEQAQEQLLVVMKALGIGKIVRNLKFEKAQGYTLTSLFISLLIMRLWGKTIASATSNHFHGFCAVSKNTLYRALLNARIRLANASYQNNPSLPCHSPGASGEYRRA